MRTATVTMLALLLFAAPAAAKLRDPQSVQISLLQKQVLALQQQVRQLRIDLTLEHNWRVCMYALDQDVFRTSVFPALDHFAIYATGQGVPAWEQIQRYDDGGACAAVGVTRP